MSFPRIAIHTGDTVSINNKHPEWRGCIVIQHNETTATILKHGKNMTKAVKNRHPLLSTFQSNCQASHWADYNADFEYAQSNDVWDYLFFGQDVKNGKVVVNDTPQNTVVGVETPVAHN